MGIPGVKLQSKKERKNWRKLQSHKDWSDNLREIVKKLEDCGNLTCIPFKVGKETMTIQKLVGVEMAPWKLVPWCNSHEQRNASLRRVLSWSNMWQETMHVHNTYVIWVKKNASPKHCVQQSEWSKQSKSGNFLIRHSNTWR